MNPMWPLCLAARKFLRMDGEEPADRVVLEDSDSLLRDEDEMNQRSRSLFRSSRLHFVDVPHVRQLFNWDCGLACILMVLRTLGIKHCEIHDLEALCPTRSIWTVDLAYLLHKFSVIFSFFTVTIGANPEFRAQAFYKEQLQDDLERVDALFERAREVGIMIQHRSISGKEISSLMLSGNYVAIALVDKYKLSHSFLNDMYVSESEFYGGNVDYIGHYVVICGYDMGSDQFDIRDPASSRKNERVSSNCLEEARKSFGTDEDILLISLKRGDAKSGPLL